MAFADEYSPFQPAFSPRSSLLVDRSPQPVALHAPVKVAAAEMNERPVAQCSICKCTEDSPCTLANGDHCNWLDHRRNVCNKWSCIKRFLANAKVRTRVTAVSNHRRVRRIL